MLKLQHLSLSTKFVLIALLFTTPVVLLGYLYVQQSLKDIRFAERERSGAAYLLQVWPLYQSALAGYELTAEQMQALVPYTRVYDAEMLTAPAREDFLNASPGKGQIAAGQLFIQKIADGSWLTLDPDLDTYYLMAATTVNLPELTAATRAIGDAAARLPKTGRPDPAMQAELLFAVGRVSGGRGALRNSVETAFAGNPDNTARPVLEQRLREALAETLRLVNEAALLANQPAGDTAVDKATPPAVAIAYNVAQAKLDTLWRDSVTELDQLLARRTDGLERQLFFNLAAALLLLIAVVGLMIAVSRSITRRLRTVAAAMNDMRAGTLERDVPNQQGRDEIGAIARTLEVFRERLISLRAFEGDLIAQETNRAAESRFRDMLDVSPIGAIIVTPDGDPLYCNAGFAAMIGATVESVMDRNIATIWYDPEERSGLMSRLRDKAKVHNLEMTLRREDGSPVHCLLSGEPVEYEGAPAALRWAYDISERKKAEAEIQLAQTRMLQSEKLASLGQLTAGIAHEIKNPLNFVNNFSDLSKDLLQELQEVLASSPLDENTRSEVASLTEMISDNLSMVLEHGRRADSIVKNMLLHSRGETGERRSVAINTIVDESLALAYHGARAEKPDFNVTLERDYDPAVGQLDIMPQGSHGCC